MLRVVRPGGDRGIVEDSAGMRLQKNPPVIEWLTDKVAGTSMWFGNEGLYVPVACPPGRIIATVSVQETPNGPLRGMVKVIPGKLSDTIARLAPEKVSVRVTDAKKGPGALESPVVITTVPGSVQISGGGGAHLRVDLSQPSNGKDYEGLCASGEAFVYVAMTRLMVRRLARA